jgi:IS4 transposase
MQSETVATEFRVIIGKNKETGQEIRFLTNISILSAGEITDLYRSRWEIETFFLNSSSKN